MKINTISLIAICVLAEQAAATYNWGGAKSFSNPSNINNECTPDQEAGFDWSDLPLGGFGSYKGFDFERFACSNSDGKRYLTTRTGAQGKFIKGKVNKNAQTAPKISCSTDKGFSITNMEVSVSYDTDIDFVYDMPDGSTCKHTESCSQDGSGVKNTQCGGATSVSLQVPQHGSDKDCDVAIHSVRFDCQPASTVISSAVTELSSTTAISSSEASSSAPTTSSETVPASSAATIVMSYSSVGSVDSASSVETSSVAETSSASTSVEVASTSSAITGVESHNSPEIISVLSTTESTSSASNIQSSTAIVASISPSNLSATYSSMDEFPTTPPTTPGDVAAPMTTSTVWSAFTLTTYACSSGVPDCPDSSIKFVTMTTAISTTICPVTSEASSASEISAPGPETSQPAPDTSASAPETSIPETETKAAPAESTPISVLPESTLAPKSSSAPGSSYVIPETPATVPDSSASSVLTPVTSEMVTTEIVYTATTSSPVTVTSTSGSSTTITTSLTLTQTVVTSTVTVCTKCTQAPPTTLTPAPPATSPDSPTTATENSASSPLPLPSYAPCPEVLPSCLNTWLSLVPQCTSNSDASCYCPSKQFTDAVIGCVQAWGASPDEMSAALSYFTGICAASIPQNLAIITAVPSTLTLCPTASVPTATVATTATTTALGQTITQSYALTSLVTSVQSAPIETVQMPVTIISYTQTLNPASGGSSSVMTTAVTVPQVSFITNTAVPATPVSNDSGVAPQATTNVGLVPAAITTPIPTASGASNGTKASATSSGVVLFTGAAVRLDANGVAGAGVAAFAGVLAFFL